MSSSSNPRDFLSSLEVSYDSDKPAESINEIYGRPAEINTGFGGEYVWLIPRKAPSAGMMVDDLWIDVCAKKDPKREDDLAKGTGGDYRYARWSNNMNASHFVTDVALWRSDAAQTTAPATWNGISQDINKNRGGQYLYLIWRTRQYTGSKPKA